MDGCAGTWSFGCTPYSTCGTKLLLYVEPKWANEKGSTRTSGFCRPTWHASVPYATWVLRDAKVRHQAQVQALRCTDYPQKTRIPPPFWPSLLFAPQTPLHP
eukprot:89380-Prymnesium_polylepis.1